MKYVFIVNPIAGNDDKEKIFYRIKSTFRRLDDEMIIEETHAPGEAKKIAADYSAKYGENCVIVSCGGDGTVHEITNGIAGTDTPMMVIPLGMGNDFAKKIYATKKINVENVIKSFGFYNGKIKYDIMPIDLIDYNGEKCINVMSYRCYRGGDGRTKMKPLHYDISYELNCCDKETGEDFVVKERHKDYALMAICNASWYGGGFCPAPHSVLDDGLLDVCLIDGLSLVEALPLIKKYSNGTLDETTSPLCHNYYIKSGKIYSENGRKLPGNCDGENFDYYEVDFKVEPKSLKLCIIKD